MAKRNFSKTNIKRMIDVINEEVMTQREKKNAEENEEEES